MVSLITIPIFPLQPDTYPAFSVHRKPTFATIYRQGRQGRSVAAPQQGAPLWEFELTYNVIRDAGQNIPLEDEFVDGQIKGKKELQKLQELYLACGGPYGEFLFWDSTDHSRETQLICTADGLIKDYPFIRTITGDAGLTFSEVVGAVNIDESIIVYIDGVPTPPGEGTWGVSLDMTTLEFASILSLGTVVHASFQYYYRCAWITDEMEFEEFAQNWWSAASIKFRSVNPIDPYIPPIEITPINPPNPPIPVLSHCLHDQQWWNHNPSPSTNITTPSIGGPSSTSPGTQAVDKFGNFYLYEGRGGFGISRLTVYGPSGNPLQTYGQADLADKIDSWYGSAIVVRTTAAYNEDFGIAAKPIMAGEYILVYVGKIGSAVPNTLARWFAVCTPTITGELDLVGACYAAAFPTVLPPYPGQFNILDVSNGQATSDPIIFIGGGFLGGLYAVIGVLPSIDDMASQFASFDPRHPLRIPNVMFYPIATADLSERLLAYTSRNDNVHGGFIIPNDAGESLLFFYFNRSYMNACLSAPLLTSPEVRNNIQPTNLHGAIIKVNLGNVDFTDLQSDEIISNPPYDSVYGTGTGDYSIDNLNWRLSLEGISALPFVDEYTYASLGNNAGGADVYGPVPALVAKRPNGKWWIIFYMAGYNDALTNGANKIYLSFRIFEFDPITEVAVQLVRDHCILHTYAENSYPNGSQGNLLQDDFYLTMSLTDEDDGSVTITAHGCVYKYLFYNFTPDVIPWV